MRITTSSSTNPAKRKGEIIGVGTYEVQPDGNTMTVEDAAGDQYLVLDRA